MRRQTQKLMVAIALAGFMVSGLAQQADARPRRGKVVRKTRGQTDQGAWKRKATTRRAPGVRDRKVRRSHTSQAGTRSNTYRSRVRRTGDNTYDRKWSNTRRGLNGERRTWMGSGSGSVERTENGWSRNYNGTARSPRGRQYGVDRNVTKSRHDSGWNKSRNATFTDSNGDIIRTHTGSSSRDGDSLYREHTVNNKHGETTRSSNWQLIDGRWTRIDG